MSDEIKLAVESGLKAVEVKLTEAVTKYEGQLKETGSVANEARDAVKALSEKFEKAVTEIAQKMHAAPGGDTEAKSIGHQFVSTAEFKSLVTGQREKVRIEIKNTIVGGTTTVFPQQVPGVIPGDFKPLTVRQMLRSIPVTSNMVNSLREASFTNDAAEVTEGSGKPESDLTFEAYNVPITTVAHWLKVSNQLLADAPAIAAYIDTRLRDGLAQRIDAQLLNGNGTPPNLSGFTDSGNFTAYTPTSDDLLVDAINRAKYTLWAKGYVPDAVVLNPGDWGAMERSKGTDGHYLYGVPALNAGTNPFGVRVVLSPNLAAGKMLIGAFNLAAVVYDRQAVTVEMGYVNDDFTNNLVTIRAEERLGLGVERPSAIYYGDFSS